VSAPRMLYEVADDFLRFFAENRLGGLEALRRLIENKADKKGMVYICNGKVYKRKPKNAECVHVQKEDAIKTLLGSTETPGEKIWRAVKELRIAIPINFYSTLAGVAYFDGGHVVQVGEWLTFIFANPEARERYWKEAKKICSVAECKADEGGTTLSARFRFTS